MPLERISGQLKLIMKIGRCRKHWNRAFTASGQAHWIRGFMTFRLVRRSRIVVLAMPAWPESGFRVRRARSQPIS